jgi:hypothetical protein
MGGSGRGWYRASSGDRAVERTAGRAADAVEFDAAANAALQDTLSAFNNRDVAGIHRHLETLRKTIESDIDGDVTMLFGGSVRKHTFVDGLSDVDVLAILNDSSLADSSPTDVLTYFQERIQKRLPDASVKPGALAITVRYSDGAEIQVLPALRTATGIRVAEPDGASWSSVVRPQEFAKKLTRVNQACGNKVVPVIKLFKGMQSNLPETNQLRGYHVESLAIEAFKEYAGRQTYKAMLQHFLATAAERVRTPISDSTGQSLHVDDYLGATGSDARLKVSSAIARLASSLRTAEARGSLDSFRDLFPN